MKVTTAFGAFLDPVADKIMVSTVLVLLAVSPPEPLSHKDLAIPVVIMIGREITMSALREWAASSGGGAHKARCQPALLLLAWQVLQCVLFVPPLDAIEQVVVACGSSTCPVHESISVACV